MKTIDILNKILDALNGFPDVDSEQKVAALKAAVELVLVEPIVPI